MPTHLSCRAIVPAIIGALALSLTLAGLAEAKASKSIPASMRVVDSSGKTLAQQDQYATDVKVDASPDAMCFGPGSTNQPHALTGTTGLTQIAQAAKLTRSLRPLSITDASSFGLGVCGIGGAEAPATGFWYVVHNHESAQVGAEQLELRKNDEVLWYLIDDFMQPTPDELELKVAKKARGSQVAVKVRSFADDGTPSPAEGTTVSGASAPTNAAGKTMVDLGGKVTKIQATRDGSIPSAVEKFCGVVSKKCPYGFAELIAGSSRADKIKGTSVAETIRSGGGKDKVRVPRGKFPVKVDCGPGKDVLRISKSRKAKIRSCEKVRRTK